MATAIIEESSGTILAHEVRWARTFTERSRGLLRERPLEVGHALVIEPCKQVHTFRMSYAIDVVFCDKAWRVKHVVHSMQPGRITRIVFASRRVVELRGGTLGVTVAPGAQLRVVASA